jgi:hypothetical protein
LKEEKLPRPIFNVLIPHLYDVRFLSFIPFPLDCFRPLHSFCLHVPVSRTSPLPPSDDAVTPRFERTLPMLTGVLQTVYLIIDRDKCEGGWSMPCLPTATEDLESREDHGIRHCDQIDILHLGRLNLRSPRVYRKKACPVT